jgi:hypothetical protein
MSLLFCICISFSFFPFFSGMSRATNQAIKVKLQQPATHTERQYGAWVGGSILASLGSLNFYMRASLWTPLATYPFPQESIMFRVRTFFQKLNESSLLCMLLSDSAIVLFSVLSGLNVLGRAMMGPCAPGASFWDTQYCNPDGPGR